LGRSTHIGGLTLRSKKGVVHLEQKSIILNHSADQTNTKTVNTYLLPTVFSLHNLQIFLTVLMLIETTHHVTAKKRHSHKFIQIN
jgi:hypothetical protein